MNSILVIEDLHASVDGKEILKGVNLEVPRGEVHALMGPNGSGKSTLAYVLMGHPAYEVIAGSITFDGSDVFELSPDERARAGMFLAFQYPHEIPGLSLMEFLRSATMAVHPDSPSLADFEESLNRGLEMLEMDSSFLHRSLNEGFSGGEKKRAEILQMMLLQPSLAVLDETDSGLDIDALRIVANGVNSQLSENFSALVITHYQRILNYLKPDRIHILHQGRIVRSGGPELASELEARGYEILKEEHVLAG